MRRRGGVYSNNNNNSIIMVFITVANISQCTEFKISSKHNNIIIKFVRTSGEQYAENHWEGGRNVCGPDAGVAVIL